MVGKEKDSFSVITHLYRISVIAATLCLLLSLAIAGTSAAEPLGGTLRVPAFTAYSEPEPEAAGEAL